MARKKKTRSIRMDQKARSRDRTNDVGSQEDRHGHDSYKLKATFKLKDIMDEDLQRKIDQFLEAMTK